MSANYSDKGGSDSRGLVTNSLSTTSEKSQSSPILKALVDISDSYCKVTVTALPIQLSLNKPCIQRMIKFFKIDDEPSIDPLSSPVLETRFRQIAAKYIEFNKDGKFELAVNMQGPKFVVPFNSSSATGGFAIVDTGDIVVKGTSDAHGLSISCFVTKVNAGEVLIRNYFFPFFAWV